MSRLPEWLWPSEDEEAVQEAERLIEETHHVLQKMEADMKVQQRISEDISFKTEKLKCAVNNKIKTLEKELKGFAEWETADQPLTQQPKPPAQDTKESSSSKQSKENAPVHNPVQTNKFTKTSRGPSKTSRIPGSRSQITSKPKETVNVAEKVVLSARSKVEEALHVARNVAASLDQRLSSTSIPSKLLTTSQTSNIGVFEVKSKAYEESPAAPKLRLKQADLPSISIKRNLDVQSIPTVQVSPGEKLTPSNTLVYNIKYNDSDNDKGQIQRKTNTKPESSSEAHHCATLCSASGFQGAIAELSKQLTQVEELREVNQAQVNHVLQFLVSRVCSTASPSEQSKKTFVQPNQQANTAMNKTVSLPSTSSSSSGSSNFPIAYDSLSRFLETYKRAAEQNMLARKRAVSRRQKIALSQKKDIEQADVDRTHHLLIGPLRQTSKLPSTDFPLSKQDSDDIVPSKNPFDSSQRIGTTPALQNDKSYPISSEEDDTSSKDQELKSDSSFKVMRDSGHSSSVNFPPKSVEVLTGDEYEDDWEEEEDQREKTEPVSDVQAAKSLETSLNPILEVEEHISSLSHSVDVQPVPSLLPLSAEKFLSDDSKRILDLEELKQNEEEQISDETQITPLSNNQPPVVEQPEVPDDNLTKSDNEEEPSVLNVPPPASSLYQIESNLGREGPVSEASNALRTFDSQQSVKVVNDLDIADGVHKTDDFVTAVGSKEVCASTKHLKNVKGKEQPSVRKRAENRHLRFSTSSSDTEPRSPSRKTKLRDLRLRDDLHLQSAILLNWQLEDRWRSRNGEASSAREQHSTQLQENAFIADVERRWQRTLDQLDQRLKTIEDKERINQVVHEIRMQSREDLLRVPVTEQKKNCDKSSLIRDNDISTIAKASTKDQIVQTSPDKTSTINITREKPFPFIGFPDYRGDGLAFQSGRPMSSQARGVSLALPTEDLTAELLTYSQMGILPRQEGSQLLPSKSPASSTSSSQIQQSSFVVSWSDGEVQGSVSGSCSCSEGEFCLCGGCKLRSQRAPPDGSQTFIDGENAFRDVSQGEITCSDLKNMQRDISNGEIVDQSSTSLPHQDVDADDGLESDSIEWN